MLTAGKYLACCAQRAYSARISIKLQLRLLVRPDSREENYLTHPPLSDKSNKILLFRLELLYDNIIPDACQSISFFTERFSMLGFKS